MRQNFLERDSNPPTFLFEKILKRKSFFLISNKTLEDIKHGFICGGVVHGSRQIQLDKLLLENNLSIVRIDDELSVIKKAKGYEFNKL